MAQSNIIMLTILLLTWILRITQVEAAQLPGADGFPIIPNTPRGRQNPNQCRNYGILSRAVTSEPIICEAIRQGHKSALETFTKKAPPAAVAAGVVSAAELVCSKAFKTRFT